MRRLNDRFCTGKIWGRAITLFVLLLFMTSLAPGSDLDRREFPVEYVQEQVPALNTAEIESVNSHAVAILPFFDDFESGIGDWTTTGFFHLKTDPQTLMVLNPTINPNLVHLPDAGYLPSAYSGIGVMWFGEDITGTFIGDFDPAQGALSGGTSNAEHMGTMVSPYIDLSGPDHAQLEFATWWEIEGVDANAFDMMYVDISTDSGSNFIVLGSLNPLNDLNGESYVPFTNSGLGEPAHWGIKQFDLTDYIGGPVLLRFRFETVDALYNGFRGWFIDDVLITASTPLAPEISEVLPDTCSTGCMFEVLGDNFANGLSVYVSSTLVPSSVLSINHIQCQVPSSMSPGTYDLIVVNPSGLADTLFNGFTVTDVQPPLIAAITPNAAGEGDSLVIEITGERFAPGAIASIGGITIPNCVRVDSTLITGTTPMTLTLGTYNVRVDNPNGLYDLLVDGFTIQPPPTTLSGYVTNASNAQPIVGAVVNLGGVTDTTDASGYYFLNDVPYGMLNAEFVASPTSGVPPLSVQFTDLSTANTQTVTAVASGYSDYTNNHVIVIANQNNILDIAMNGTIAAGQMRFVLTWDDDPSDLDSHMETPPIDGSPYHVYYSSKGDSIGPPYVRLDVDDVTGYGPETITVYDMFDGTYYYYIYKYYGNEEIIQSSAVVQIYDSEGLVQTLAVPTTGTGRYWDVCTVNGTTGEITYINQIRDTEPGPLAAPATEDLAMKQEAHINTNAPMTTSAITSWTWDFGDGENSSEQHPLHIYNAAGTYTVSLTVSDGIYTSMRTRTDYILAIDPPEVHWQIVDGSVYEDQPMEITIDPTNFRSSSLHFEAPYMPDFLSWNTDTTSLIGTPLNADVGNNSFDLLVWDEVYGDSVSVTISFDVINEQSEITTLPPTAILVGMEYVYDINSSDEGSGLIYNLEEGPAFLSMNDSSGVLSGTPAAADVGAHYIRILADDRNGSAETQEWILSVLPSNDDGEPPVLDSLPPIAFYEDDTSAVILLNDLVTDNDTPDDELQWFFNADGNTNLYAMLYEEPVVGKSATSVTGLNVLYDPEVQELRLYGAPDWFGETLLTCLVTDGDHIAIGTMAVTVINVNDAPVLLPFANVVFLEDESSALYDLSRFVTDIDNEAGTLDWSVTGADTLIPALTDGKLQFSAPQDWNGQENMTLHVSDAEYSDSCDFLVVVSPVNDPPENFGLSLPAPDAQLDSAHIRFSWETAHDVDKDDEVVYILILTNSDNGAIVIEQTLSETEWIWDSGVDGNYTWSVEARDLAYEITSGGSRSFSVSIISELADIPSEFMLGQNYPNPFNPSTHIPFALPVETEVRLTIYDLSGQVVREWQADILSAGRYDQIWDGRDRSGHIVPTGVYIYRLKTDTDLQTRKMLFIK